MDSFGIGGEVHLEDFMVVDAIAGFNGQFAPTGGMASTTSFIPRSPLLLPSTHSSTVTAALTK